MKRLKKLLAVLVTMITVIAMAIPVSVSAAGDYTVTIIPNDSATHTFTAYQIFSGTISSDGVTLTDIEWGRGVNGAALLSAIIDANADSTSGNVLYNTITDPTTFTSAADVADWLSDNANTEGFAEAFATLALSCLGTAAGTVTAADGDGYYRITGLDAGYYLITDEVTGGNGKASDTLLSVLSNVTITAKSELPSVMKTANTDTARIGDTITYTITGTLTGANLTKTPYSYTLIDTMESCLDLVYTYPSGNTSDVNGGVTVTVNDGNNTYDVTQYFTITYVTDGSGNHVLTLTCDNVTSMGSVSVSNDTVFTITYSATVNSNLGDGSIENTVQLITEEYQTPEIKETVYAIDLNITKTDGSTGDVITTGATFVLKNSSGEYLQVDTNNKVYKWVTEKDDASELTTDSLGKLNVYGLSAGTYYLEEIVAPEGYNLLVSDLTIVITAATDASTGELTSLKYTVDGGASQNGTISTTGNSVAITVENNQGATLPSTGGIGTTLLYVCGSILALVIVVLLITKIRMKAED